jgi:hypothetical protein
MARQVAYNQWMASDGSMHGSLSAAQAHERRLAAPQPVDPNRQYKNQGEIGEVIYHGKTAYVSADGITRPTYEEAVTVNQQLGGGAWKAPTGAEIGTVQGHGTTIYVTSDGQTHASMRDAQNHVHEMNLGAEANTPKPTRPVPGQPAGAASQPSAFERNVPAYGAPGWNAVPGMAGGGNPRLVPGVGQTPAGGPPAPQAPDYGAQAAMIDQMRRQATERAHYEQYLRPAEEAFRAEMDRLSQDDPFGNQAFLQRATDRGVAQARAVAAGARGGAGAVGGALRQAQGVQSALAAQGAQEMAQLKAQDQRQAQAGRLAAAQGLAGLGQTGAQLAVEDRKITLDALDRAFGAMQGNEQLKLAWAGLDQANRHKMLDYITALSQIDANLYQTDMAYREAVNNQLTTMRGQDKQLEAVLKQIDSQPEAWQQILGVGMQAGGMVVGGLVGGPPGAAVGGQVGKTMGPSVAQIPINKG